ncbi:alcohol dehydrogenase catalytic domain-containing protein [Nocardioides sp. KIGAM211]|uniref:Alcohol dehydrogenase catalytic domain-containing protein n=1 Tax=Nocardioides luti TaxID=2761101 RepID=A0A7X0RFX6_9ACTN|nr:alcohol dehydrogenase catalytic domain-containing protein [Nocardioides luti]MBB6627482.1 alcohol dehydrogenase catalytic domain-containing protein [Nocardioides luti]
MRAVVVHEFARPASVEVVDDPGCPPDGVVVAVAATGLCRSDWHAWVGHEPDIPLPHVPGHELAGTVAEVGPDVTGWRVGDRVTTPFVLACGACRSCARGDQQVCERQLQPGFTQWGSFAELVALPRADVNLVRIPDEVSADVAAGLGCRFGTAYRAVAQVADVRAGETVVVHGCGGVGLSVVMVALARGARVLGVDVAPESLALVAELGGEPVPADEVGSLVDLTGGGADASLDALGSTATFANSLACLRPRGRHVQVGLLLGEHATPAVAMGDVVARELQVLGSHGMSAAAYPELLALVTDGTLAPQRLVTGTIGLDEAPARLADLGRPGSGAGGITVIRP